MLLLLLNSLMMTYRCYSFLLGKSQILPSDFKSAILYTVVAENVAWKNPERYFDHILAFIEV